MKYFFIDLIRIFFKQIIHNCDWLKEMWGICECDSNPITQKNYKCLVDNIQTLTIGTQVVIQYVKLE